MLLAILWLHRIKWHPFLRVVTAQKRQPLVQIPHDHEGCGTAAPAFPNVGAVGFFTDGMKIELSGALFNLRVALTTGCADFEPRGLISGHLNLHIGLMA